MSDNPLFTVPERFHRSANIETDGGNLATLEGYVLTDSVRKLLEAFESEWSDPMGDRSWSIVGPYGSGKSSFALFLQMYASGRYEAYRMFKALREEGLVLPRLFPIPVVGARMDLQRMVAKGLSSAEEELGLDVDPDNPDLTQRWSNIGDAAKAAGYDGALLVLDEFGKVLEHTASIPDADLYLLQELAEHAQSYDGVLSLVTVLHMSYAEYIGALDDGQRAEWQKIQGRFREVKFREPNGQFVRLINTAIQPSSKAKAVTERHALANDMLAGSDFLEALRDVDPKDVIGATPLHPATTLLLWPVFRSSIAQNERSLFHFLTSNDHAGFAEHLGACTQDHVPWFAPHHLFDFIDEHLGVSSFTGTNAKRWAEALAGLAKLDADAPIECESLIKCIALLSIFGRQVRLFPTQEVLSGIFAGDTFEPALQHLIERSIVMERRHERAYALWAGSDVDLERLHAEQLSGLAGKTTADVMMSCFPASELSSLRHFIRTGAHRNFETRVVGAEAFLQAKEMTRLGPNRPGQVVFVLDLDGERKDALVEHAKDLTGGKDVHAQQSLVAVSALTSETEASARALLAWKGLLATSSEVAEDEVAKTEVQARINAIGDQLMPQRNVYGGDGGIVEPSLSQWVSRGEEQRIHDGRSLHETLDDLATEAFPSYPTLLNEMINRDEPSSSGSRAVRNLIQAMIEEEHTPRLGIKGYPPQVTIYEGMLKGGGMLEETESGVYLTAPEGPWEAVWSYLLRRCTKERRPVDALFAELEARPFGLKRGVMAVLLCAVQRVHQREFALYETYDGGSTHVFVPEPTIEHFERLYRAPGNFSARFYPMDASHQALLAALNKRLFGSDEARPSMLDVVRPLVVSVAKMPKYTRKTRNLASPRTSQFRDALLSTSDPLDLLHAELPRVLEVEVNGPEDASLLVDRVAEEYTVLAGAYALLHDSVEQGLRGAFGLTGGDAGVRKQLKKKGTSVLQVASQHDALGPLCREMSNLRGRDWVDVLARVINKGIPPKEWSDRQVSEFHERLSRVGWEFNAHFELAQELGEDAGGAFVRLHDAVDEDANGTRLIRVGRAGTKEEEKHLAELLALIPEDLDDTARDAWVRALARGLHQVSRR